MWANSRGHGPDSVALAVAPVSTGSYINALAVRGVSFTPESTHLGAAPFSAPYIYDSLARWLCREPRGWRLHA